MGRAQSPERESTQSAHSNFNTDSPRRALKYLPSTYLRATEYVLSLSQYQLYGRSSVTCFKLAHPSPRVKKKENRQPKGGMGGRPVLCPSRSVKFFYCLLPHKQRRAQQVFMSRPKREAAQKACDFLNSLQSEDKDVAHLPCVGVGHTDMLRRVCLCACSEGARV